MPFCTEQVKGRSGAIGRCMFQAKDGRTKCALHDDCEYCISKAHVDRTLYRCETCHRTVCSNQATAGIFRDGKGHRRGGEWCGPCHEVAQ